MPDNQIISQNTGRQLNVIPAEEITRRFDKLESKLDKLSDAMVILARNEEKLANMEDLISNLQNRLNRHSEKLDLTEKIADANHRSINNIMKLWWVILTAIVAVGFKVFFDVQI